MRLAHPLWRGRLERPSSGSRQTMSAYSVHPAIALIRTCKTILQRLHFECASVAGTNVLGNITFGVGLAKRKPWGPHGQGDTLRLWLRESEGDVLTYTQNGVVAPVSSVLYVKDNHHAGCLISTPPPSDVGWCLESHGTASSCAMTGSLQYCLTRSLQQCHDRVTQIVL